jgi:hypothetical protein
MQKQMVIFMVVVLYLMLAGINTLPAQTEQNPVNDSGSAPGDSGAVIQFNHEKQGLMQQAADNEQQEPDASGLRKSGIKAALMSGLVPGAGQVYTHSYWRAAAYFVLEAALWTGNIMYNNKGDDEDKKMKAFGDLHWSERRYWTYIYNQVKDKEIWKEGVLSISDAEYGIDDAAFTPDVKQALRDVETLNNTHSLPSTKTQQYYEMIYKYLHQFGAGWDDYGASQSGELTPNVLAYRTIRNRSNDYYATADNMVKVVLLNHVISALDAAWSAKQYNKKVVYSLNAGLRRINGERINFYGLSVAW